MSDPDRTAGGDALLDLGAQSERTALAWQRTGLTAIAVGALFVHHHPQLLSSGLLLVTVGALSAGVMAPLRYRQILRAVQAQCSPAEPRTVLLFTVLMGVIGITTELVAVLSG